MKRTTITFVLGISFLLFLLSCQKEVSFEQGKTAKGSLLNDFGDCLPKVIKGVYIVNQPLTDSNYMDVSVNISQAGNYSISTDTVNGYSFKATGKFATIGAATVRLKGSGKPLAGGVDNFFVRFDSSFCNIPVTVLAGGSSSGGSAVYTVQPGAAGACMNTNVTGTYTQGVALTPANKVSIEVNVTTVGTWTMTLAPVGGISFSSSGSFAATGVQTIILNGSGTPSGSGAQTFTVTAGSSSCTFVVTVAGGSTPSPNDYFPRTPNSHWTYILDGNASDSVRRYVSTSTISALGNTYSLFMETAGSTVDTSGAYRRAGGDYYVYGDVGTSYGFDKPLMGEMILLKDNVPAGTSWTTPAFSGTVSGIPVSVRYKGTVLQKDVSIVVTGVTYPNTIVIKHQQELNTGGTGWVDFTPFLGYYITYYSRNIGLIKTEVYDSAGTLKTSNDLKDYVVF